MLKAAYILPRCPTMWSQTEPQGFRKDWRSQQATWAIFFAGSSVMHQSGHMLQGFGCLRPDSFQQMGRSRADYQDQGSQSVASTSRQLSLPVCFRQLCLGCIRAEHALTRQTIKNCRSW